MTTALRYSLLCLLLVFTVQEVKSQGSWELVIHSDSFVEKEASSYLFPDSSSMNTYLEKEIEDLVGQGHLSAALDSLVKVDDTFHAYLFEGPKVILFQETVASRRRLDYEELIKGAVKELEEIENSGYPFASSSISFRLGQDTVFAYEKYASGSLFLLDSIIQLGDEVMDTRALSAHLRVKEGELYSEGKLKKMDARLKRLSFVKVMRPTQVIFSKDRYRILLAIEKRKANSANGIIGFLPDNDGKVRTTGEIDLLLNNALNQADKMSLNWRRIQDGSQSLDFAISYPYLFGSPLGIRASINQFRQDSTFNQIQLKGGLSLLLENGDVISAEVEKRDFNNLLTVSFGLANANSNSLLYGAQYLHNTLDDPFNPYQGMDLTARVSYGDKNLLTNSEAMGSEEQNLDTWEIALDLKQFIPIGNRSTLLLRAHAFHQESDIILFKELQRIGGLFTLRGMDEMSIRASSYGIMTLEYRFLTEERAYISAFTDVAYHSSEINNLTEEDTPYGVGLGTAFDTGGGVFTLSYALGSQFGAPLSFRTGKIHFGFIALF